MVLDLSGTLMNCVCSCDRGTISYSKILLSHGSSGWSCFYSGFFVVEKQISYVFAALEMTAF